MTDEEKLFARANICWGQDAQFDMVNEECAELIVALNRWRRGRCFVKDVAEEIADVSIMLEQLKYQLGCDRLVEQERAEKIRRLRERLEEWERRKEYGG